MQVVVTASTQFLLPFLLSCMYVNQGARRTPYGKQPPVKGRAKSTTAEEEQFKGKFISIKNNPFTPNDENS